jgi:O-antigen ligase
MGLLNKKSSLFLFILLFELISLLGYIFADIRQISFLMITLLFLIISLKNLKAGVLILLIELFIGSRGYLFYFEQDGLIISLRIAFWLIILSVWLAKSITNYKLQITNFKKQIPWQLVVFFVFIFWGATNGLLRGNELSNIFFDFNNWLYFALIFPIFSAIKTRDDLKMLWQIFLISIIWLSFKTFVLLFFFSHNIPGTIEMLYGWVRTSGVGEITLIQGGFYRIFFQSHIYNLIAFFIFLILTASAIKRNDKKLFTTHYLLLTTNLSIILLSFSRSFWIGLIVGLLCSAVYIIWQYNWKLLFKMFGLILLSSILSLALITAIVKFPYPNPLGGFSTTDLLSSRAKQISGEAAVSSRWNLLPELWTEIKKAPIAGSGLGATVTYKSNDPRILETTTDGKFTTYAFEWGWLDIWLKFGFLGFLAYLFLIFKLTTDSLKLIKKGGEKEKNLASGLLISLSALLIIHFFTPYLNHPLGIGFIILLILAINIYNKNNA